MLGRGEFANALQMKGGRIAGGRRARAGAATRSNFRAAPELEYQIFWRSFRTPGRSTSTRTAMCAPIFGRRPAMTLDEARLAAL